MSIKNFRTTIYQVLLAVGIFIALGMLIQHPSASAQYSSAIGRIEPPPGVEEQNAEFMAQGNPDSKIAIFFFLSKFLIVINVIAGLWVLVNIMLAAFEYITSQGKAEAHQKVREKLTMSVMGLALLVVAYMAIALLSSLFFGDPGFILNPKL